MTATAPPTSLKGTPERWSRFVKNALLLALGWLGLNGTDFKPWLIGVPAVLTAAALGATLPARHTLHALDLNGEVSGELRALEERVRRLFKEAKEDRT